MAPELLQEIVNNGLYFINFINISNFFDANFELTWYGIYQIILISQHEKSATVITSLLAKSENSFKTFNFLFIKSGWS